MFSARALVFLAEKNAPKRMTSLLKEDVLAGPFWPVEVTRSSSFRSHERMDCEYLDALWNWLRSRRWSHNDSSWLEMVFQKSFGPLVAKTCAAPPLNPWKLERNPPEGQVSFSKSLWSIVHCPRFRCQKLDHESLRGCFPNRLSRWRPFCLFVCSLRS